MLKAYDYAEIKSKKGSLKNKKLFNQEKILAQKYVLEHPTKLQECSCPVCGHEYTQYIFARWDVNYQFCNSCNSIFVPVEATTLEGYLAMPQMEELRSSDEYQEELEKRRADIWDEQIFWAEYRIYRYLRKNEHLDIIDYGNRNKGLSERFRNSKLCGQYELRDSILSMNTNKLEKADVLLYMNQLQHTLNPIEILSKLRDSIKDDGLLILNTRLGSGFDILTLKGGIDNIFPYEHVMLPSRKGLEKILDKAGYELLEITTPGTMDMEYVLENKERVDHSNFFVKYLLNNVDAGGLVDFQQFLQKSGLSSFAQVIARKRKS